MENTFLIIFSTFLLITSTLFAKLKYDNKKDYLEDSRMYFNYGEYEKAIESALMVYEHENEKIKVEESLYLINESIEDIVYDLKNQLFSVPSEKIEKEIDYLKKNYNIRIVFKRIEYEYILYYDKGYYKKLLSLNPKSEFIDKIKLRNYIRLSKSIVDSKYRYSQMLHVIDKYWDIFYQEPQAGWAPQLLLKIADMYLTLYENREIVKRELNLTEKKLEEFFSQAKEIFKKIKKEYPHSSASQSIAYVIENVKLRDEPKSKSKLIMKIQAGTLVQILDRTEKREAISNMYEYWYKVRLISGLEGWIYGFYLRTTY